MRINHNNRDVRIVDCLQGFNNSIISGKLNLFTSELVVNADIPEFTYDKKKFRNVILQGSGNRDTLRANLSVEDIALSDSLSFPNTKLEITANNDVSVIHLKTSASKTLNDAQLNASIQTLSDGVKINFFPSSFIINNKKWELAEFTARERAGDFSSRATLSIS